MVSRPIGRAGALAATFLLLFSGTAFADSVAADGDQVSSGVQTYVDLGSVAPGAVIVRDVTLTLFCGGVNHVDPGQVVTVSQASVAVPEAGGSISATDATFEPVPDSWPVDTAGATGCTGPMQVEAVTPSQVTIVAPNTPGLDYAFVIEYGRTFAPAGVADASSISGYTTVALILDVEDPSGDPPTDDPPGDATPPTFDTVATDIDVVTYDPDGRVVDYPWPSAADDLDPWPSITCDPAQGTVFAVGPTVVTCTAIDATGNSASQSFTVNVHLSVVVWGPPVRANRETTFHRGRSLPIRARAWLDGVPWLVRRRSSSRRAAIPARPR